MIATLLLVEKKESSQHRVRKSGENLVPKERYTLHCILDNFKNQVFLSDSNNS